MRIAGIDLSTKKIAVSLFDGEEASSFEVEVKGRRAADRFRSLVEEFGKRMSKVETDFVFIEDISFVRNRQAELDLAQILGAVKGVLYYFDKPPLTFNNQSIKAYFNQSRSSKQEIVEFVGKVTGLPDLSEDQSDAFLVAMYGRSMIGIGKVKTDG